MSEYTVKLYQNVSNPYRYPSNLWPNSVCQHIPWFQILIGILATKGFISIPPFHFCFKSLQVSQQHSITGVRIFDMPRFQILIGILATLAAYVATRKKDSFKSLQVSQQQSLTSCTSLSISVSNPYRYPSNSFPHTRTNRLIKVSNPYGILATI